MLRANLEFVNLDRGARSIMVTSALEKEGKSTTVANLAVALARAGQKVALVDLDLRRPAIASFFGIPYSDPGMTNIVVGSSTLEQALVEVSRTPMAAARRVSCRRKRRRLERQRWRAQGADVGPDSAQPRRARQGKAADGRARAARPVLRLRPHRHASAALGRGRDGPERPCRRDDHGRPSENAQAAESLPSLPGRSRPARRSSSVSSSRGPKPSRGTATAAATNTTARRSRRRNGCPFLPRARHPPSRRSRCGEPWRSTTGGAARARLGPDSGSRAD